MNDRLAVRVQTSGVQAFEQLELDGATSSQTGGVQCFLGLCVGVAVGVVLEFFWCGRMAVAFRAAIAVRL